MADKTLKFLLLGEDRTASKALKGVGTEADKAKGKLTGLGGSMKGALTTGAIIAAGAAVVQFGGDSVKAFMDADKSQRQLEDAYRRFPAVQDVSIEKMRELSQAIQDKTGADADDIASSQAVLARHKLTGSQIADMTPLLVDYAKRTGKDLPAAGNVLGKALGGNAKAMKELGIKFKDTGDPAKNFDQIMKGLKDKVGGFAEGEAGTLDGKLGKLQTKFGDVQEKVGGALVPALEKLADVASVVVDWISQNADIMGPLAIGLGAAAAAMVLLNIAMAANPVGIIVVAIGALVAGLVMAYQKSEGFRNIVNGAFQAIGKVAQWLWNVVIAPLVRGWILGFANVVEAIAAVLDALGNIPGFEWAKEGAKNLRGMGKDARTLADNIKDIPDADPQIKAKDEATSKIKKIDAEIKKLKGKIVEAKAKGDDKEVKALQNKINALKSKKVQIQANVYKTGISTITVRTTGTSTISVRAVARGGILGARSYASGGIEDHSPRIYGPGDGMRIFNEPETHGEAYIPLNPDRRGRALAIWRETGRRLGVAGYARGGVSGGSAVGGSPVTIMVQGDTDPLGAARRIEAHLAKLWESKGRRPLAFQRG